MDSAVLIERLIERGEQTPIDLNELERLCSDKEVCMAQAVCRYVGIQRGRASDRCDKEMRSA